MAKSVYKNPQVGQPLLATISSGCKTPILEVKFSTLLKPFYYPNSPTIARYSITCLIDAKSDAEFLKNLQTIEKNEGVATIIKHETKKEGSVPVYTGNFLIKFQSKDKIPCYTEDGEPVELEDELARGEKIMVEYDILRYTKKGTAQTEHGISFKPTSIFYYPSKKLKQKWQSMNKVRILGIDPSLRNTGIAMVEFDTEKSRTDPTAFKVEHCQVIVNPHKFKGLDAILNMVNLIYAVKYHSFGILNKELDKIIIESPVAIFNQAWSGASIAGISHISGACIAIFDRTKTKLYRPNQWTKNKKKEVTHNNTISFLGDPDRWGYDVRVKNEKLMEHILDAASMALHWIKENYIEE